MLEEKDVKKGERWILKAFEVMKYDPKFRDSEGNYTKEEWTTFDDIGKQIDNTKLSFNDYKLVEDRYIQAVEILFNYYDCNKIQFVKERFFLDADDIGEVMDKELELFYFKLQKRRTLSLEETLNAVKLILRGAVTGMFYAKRQKQIAVRFGYDFYMYFNAPDAEDIRKKIEKETGLYTTR